MHIKTTQPLYKPQIASGFVRRAGEAQQNKPFNFAAATITNIPSLSGCQMFNLV